MKPKHPEIFQCLKKKNGDEPSDEDQPDFGNMMDYGSIFEAQEKMESNESEDAEKETDDNFSIAADFLDPIATDEDQEDDVTSETEFGAETIRSAGSAGSILDDDSEDTGALISETETVKPEDIFGSMDAGGAEEFQVPSEMEIEDLLAPPGITAMEESKPEPAPAVEAPKELDPEEQKRHEKSRRIARVIINDIRNYNPDKLAEGIRIGNIVKTLGVEIERGRQLYIKRVPPDIARSTNYYRESLIKILSDGRPELLGM